jgi:H+/Cl- antiporter ClcA
MSGRAYLRVILIAAAIGIPAALLAALFLALVHNVEHWLWHDIPDALGHSAPPWYLVIGLPVVGALVVVFARRLLPGDGGPRPLEGLSSAPTPVVNIAGVVLAALGTLGFGAVLGPEMPVIAIGSATGLAVTRWVRLDERGKAVLSGAGSFAAVSALFGGPLVAGILLVESGIEMGAALLPALLPGFVAAAVGYVLFVGFGHWGGLNAPGLLVPHLPVYHGTHFDGLALAIVLGVAAALLIRLVHHLGVGVEAIASRSGMPALLLAGGLAVGLLAQIARWLGANSQDVLFSGQASLPALLDERSTKVLVVLLVAKFLAYAVSLGCGYRGGPIFPAIFVGVALATFSVVWFHTSPTWAIVAGTAAGMAAQTRLLISPLLFGALLAGTAGLDAVPAAVLATAASFITTVSLDQRGQRAAGGAAPEAAD